MKIKIKWFIPITNCVLLLPITSCNCKDVPGTETYLVKTYKSEDKINWNNVDKATINIYKWFKDCPRYESYAQMVYIQQQKFVVRLTSYEKGVTATLGPGWSGDTYKDSCLEAFFQFAPNGKYINIETNSALSKCQEYGEKSTGATWSREPLWQTSLTNCFDVDLSINDDYWQITIDMPLDKIIYWYNRDYQWLSRDDFKSGFTFWGNFYKVRGDDSQFKHYGMWSEIDANQPDCHRPDCFGQLKIK